ncbi:MAG: alanine racemase [Chloroflexi bacterium]|nr:alanine racemase [Chloroflexota bacterium]
MTPSRWTGRPAWVEVDLDAIAANVAEARRRLASHTALGVVVKANAYGHGVLAVAEAALAAGATWLVVNAADEALQLRRAGFQAPVLIVGFTAPGEAAAIVDSRVTPSLTAAAQIEALTAAARAAGITQPVHVKVDTGLGRGGLLPDEVLPFVRKVVAVGLDFEGLFTHFAVADSADKSHSRSQLQRFHAVLAELDAAGMRPRIRHAANSAAVLDLPDAHFDLVRYGIALYGLDPSDEVGPAFPLRPALSLKGGIVRLRTLPAGATVGYGCTFVATRPTKVALVPIGYADGLRRGLSNQGFALVRGSRCPIIGRVSMDQCSLDVTSVPDVSEGDEVVFVGTQNDATVTADEVAALLDTINYEVVCGLGPRLPRVYLRDGRIASVYKALET